MKRLLSLDILRGITVAGMILVNNGGGPHTFAQLRHCAWNGMTACDLIFPFFLFMVGISTYLSLSKAAFRPSGTLVRKILKRTLLIAAVGWGIHWFAAICSGDFLPFDHLRIPGVLPRIALCYGLVSLMAITLPHKGFPWIAGGLLVVYAGLLDMGNGYRQDTTNLIAVIDRAILGETHLYHKSPVDPEGLLSTLAAVSHTLIGFCCGRIILTTSDKKDKVLRLFVTGFLLLAVGYLLTDAWPLNKRIWSPTFVLMSCGTGTLLLATLMFIIDVQGQRGRWQTFFHVFGVNPLFLYVVSELAAIVLDSLQAKAPIYQALEAVTVNPYLASLAYAVLFVGVMGALGYPLYKKKIYIKL